MIATLLLIAVLAGVLVPLIQRDLRRAVVCREVDEQVRTLVADFEAFEQALRALGLAAAVAAAQMQRFGRELRR